MKKGHDLTLRDTWAYRESIEVHVDPAGVEVGVFDPKIGEYVFWNEHSTKKGIPARLYSARQCGLGCSDIQHTNWSSPNHRHGDVIFL